MTTARTLKATLNLQRKAALASGRASDHAGRVRVVPRADFEMGRTIFRDLEGRLPRLVMHDKMAKETFWSESAISTIEADYERAEAASPTPEIDEDLIDFMLDECDFSMEHADGTFLEHLVFCHDYSARFFPEHSARVALLHSILGTATNTFAMDVAKLARLKERLTPFESLHIELFPTTLRLFYDGHFIPELRENLHRLDRLVALRCHRVIDNEPLVVEAEDLWVNLNYHLMHFLDFMPPANWGTHRADPLLLQFRELSSFLDDAGQRRAQVDVGFPDAARLPRGEVPTMAGVLAQAIPVRVRSELAKKTIRKYSAQIGHRLDYQLEWSSH